MQEVSRGHSARPRVQDVAFPLAEAFRYVADVFDLHPLQCVFVMIFGRWIRDEVS
jgi:hypothetical protein